MTSLHAFVLVAFAALIVEAPSFSQEVAIPKLSRRVTDLTSTLSASESESLELQLARFEDSTSNQVNVVLISTLGSESLEDFALRTSETNGVGQKKKDNGVLLLIVKDDRKIRIEVGYGLEGVLPDALSGQIIRREITPFFRSGDYYAGIKAGVDAIILATRNEYKGDSRKAKDGSPLIALLVFALIFFFIMRSARRRHGMMGALPFMFMGGGPRSSGGWGSGGGGFGGFSGGGGGFGGGGSSGGW